MKILVTGSSGFLGTPVVQALKQQHTVIEFDLLNRKDILDYSKLTQEMKNCDVVVHLAAIPKPMEDKSFDDYLTINCIGTHNVVKAAIEAKVKKFVYASSTTYYGVEKGIPFKHPIKEDQQTPPMYIKAEQLSCRDCDLAYSESKIIAENILAFYGLTKKIQVVILRFSAIGKTFLNTSVSVANAVQGVVRAVNSEKTMWYEPFNIVDNIPTIENAKSKKLLNYNPS